MVVNERPITRAVESAFDRLRSWAESLREGEQRPALDAELVTGDIVTGVPAKVLWSGTSSYRWWHSPLLSFEFLFSVLASLMLAAGGGFMILTGGLIPGMLLATLGTLFGLGSADELRRSYSDRRKRYYVLTEVRLKDCGVTSSASTQLRAIARYELRRHRDGTGTISYQTTTGYENKLLRLVDADVVYLLLREYVADATERRERD